MKKRKPNGKYIQSMIDKGYITEWGEPRMCHVCGSIDLECMLDLDKFCNNCGIITGITYYAALRDETNKGDIDD